MDIAIVTTAKNNGEAKELLGALGMPFRKIEDQELKEVLVKRKEEGQAGKK
jgi:hypothetical protein